jgi:vacuolar-type H+-ATPase subunit F/Vma7
MSQLTVVVPPELADGYRLAGVRAEEADSAAAAALVLDRITAASGHPGGVIAVHHPYLRELDKRWQRKLAQPDGFLIVALPEGLLRGTEPASRGESLRDMLARAAGYEFTFDPGGRPG